MDRVLAILADESDYSLELASYLRTRDNFIFKPLLFNSISEIQEYKKENCLDMLLCPSGTEIRDLSQIEKVCYLCENIDVYEKQHNKNKGNIRYIFKYQSSEAIMRELIDCYSDNNKDDENSQADPDDGKRLVCVYSPSGGCYSSTFALALAEYYSKGGNTLFISFDPFFIYPGETKNLTDRNLTDLMYYMEVTYAGVGSFVESLAVHKGTLDYVSGVSHWFDIADMSRKKVRILLDALSKYDKYRNIVFDLGRMGEASIEMLSGCKSVYLPLKNSGSCTRAVDEWKRQIRFANHNEIIEKTKELEVPYDELLEGEYNFDHLLKGHLGRFIEDMEGLRYCR